MKIIEIFLAVWCFLITFYTLYIAAINVYDERVAISNWVIAVSLPMLILMLVIDCASQFTWVTVMFADLPKEPTVSQRLERYRTLPAYAGTWRESIATFICTKFLNPFDPTKHHC